MCNFRQLGEHVARAMSQYGHDVQDTFPVQVRLIPPERVRRNECPLSGQKLEHHAMYPSNAATPRHTAQHVYEALVNPQDDTKCGLCGCGLDMDIVGQFRANRREVSFRFCPECRDYFGLMAAVVHGDPLAIGVMGGPRQIAYEPQKTIGDIINMVPVRQPLPIKVR